MQLDSTIGGIMEKIERSFIREFNREIDQEDLLYIVNSQLKNISIAMRDGEVIKLDKLGKFLQKEGRLKALKAHRGK